jgi:4-amino-4-deoxy-L-arabinose transferase-like glycosyltransferase
MMFLSRLLAFTLLFCSTLATGALAALLIGILIGLTRPATMPGEIVLAALAALCLFISERLAIYLTHIPPQDRS